MSMHKSLLGFNGEDTRQVYASTVKKDRKVLIAAMNFQTGFDRQGRTVYGCKVIVTKKGWLVTAFPV